MGPAVCPSAQNKAFVFAFVGPADESCFVLPPCFAVL